jgi:type I restriction enzyme S subunit
MVNPQKEPRKLIRYIQYSNVDKTLGDVTSHLEMSGDEAPLRAKLLVSKGDIIAAKVKDSEENVTIIPDEYDGAVASSGFVVLKPIYPMTSEALFVLLRLQSTYNQVRWKSSGTILPAISDDEYLTIKIPKLATDQIELFTKEVKNINEQRAFIKEKLRQLSVEIKE